MTANAQGLVDQTQKKLSRRPRTESRKEEIMQWNRNKKLFRMQGTFHMRIICLNLPITYLYLSCNVVSARTEVWSCLTEVLRDEKPLWRLKVSLLVKLASFLKNLRRTDSTVFEELNNELFHHGNHRFHWRVCNEINYTGLAKIQETNGAILTFVLIFLLMTWSIKSITDE